MALSDLISSVSDLGKLGKKEAKAAMDAVFGAIEQALSSGGPVRTAFGTFSVSERKARKGRNPRTGETVDIAASKSVRFKPSKAVRERIAGGKKGSRSGAKSGGAAKAGARGGRKTAKRGR